MKGKYIFKDFFKFYMAQILAQKVENRYLKDDGCNDGDDGNDVEER